MSAPLPPYATGKSRKNPKTEKADCPRCKNPLPMRVCGTSRFDSETELCPNCCTWEAVAGVGKYAPAENNVQAFES